MFSVFICLLLLVARVSGQQSPYRFTRYNVDDGLSQNWIRAIGQDSSGVMWFGTKDGLDRFNGYHFNSFKYIPYSNSGLNHPTVNSIVASRHKLWIGTNGGMNIFDLSDDKLTSFPFLRNQSVTCITPDQNGNTWIGTDTGLYRLPADQHLLTRVDADILSGDLIGDTIQCLLVDRENSLWAGTNNGLNRIFKDATGNFLIDKFSVKDGLFSGNIRTLIKGPSGSILVGSNDGGLNLISRDGMAHGKYKIKSLLEGSIICLAIDNRGYLWAGHANGEGLDYADISDLDNITVLQHFVNNPGDATSISDNSISSLFVDSYGGIWIGTHGGGICYYDYRMKNFFTVAPEKTGKNYINSPIVNVFFDDNRYFWIGTENGLSRINRKDNTIKIFTHNPDDPWSLAANAVFDIFRDSRGHLWIGTWAGELNYYDYEKERFIKLDKPEPGTVGSLKGVYAIFEDSRGNLWVGTHGTGLVMVDNKKMQIKNVFKYNPENPNTIANNSVSVITEYNGYLWVSSYNALNRYDYTTGTFRRYVHNEEDTSTLSLGDIEVLFTDSHNHLWVGTETGLNLYLPGKDAFRHFTTLSGLPGNAVKGMLEDDDNNLWISTNHGLSKFIDGAVVPEKLFFRNFSVDDGLQGNEFIKRAAYKDQQGRLYFGGVNGYSYFFPDSIRVNTRVPDVILTRFLLSNKPQNPGGKGSILPSAINTLTEIKLPYHLNDIGFRWAALNYLNPGQSNYKFMLEGYEKEWNVAGKSHSASYTNLDPGEYVFRVIASNNDDVWNKKGVSLKITIMPPWWKTIWFHIFSVLFVAAAVWGIYKLRVRTLQNRNKLLEKKVRERTEALHELNNQLEESKEEVTQQNDQLEYHRKNLEKLVQERTFELERAMRRAEEADKLKSHFLANISHEIRTPMNAIIGFSSLLRDRETSKENRDRFIEIINNSCQTLLVLIDDMLEISLIESNQVQIVKREFEVNKVLAELEQYYNLNKPEELVIRFDQPEEPAPLTIFNDAIRFRQIFSNLINNALKFTGKGHIYFGYFLKDDQVEFYVSDTGIGINSGDRQRIFMMFQKAETNQDRFYQGAGLGLPISKKLVEMMGGNMWVDSSPGKGGLLLFYPSC